MRLINSTKLVPAGLAIKAIRRFSPTNPSEVAINKKDHYLACWTGNKEMWLEMCSRTDHTGTSWSIVVAPTRKAVEFTWHCYFYANNLAIILYICEAIALYIVETGFKFR